MSCKRKTGKCSYLQYITTYLHFHMIPLAVSYLVVWKLAILPCFSGFCPMSVCYKAKQFRACSTFLSKHDVSIENWEISLFREEHGFNSRALSQVIHNNNARSQSFIYLYISQTVWNGVKKKHAAILEGMILGVFQIFFKFRKNHTKWRHYMIWSLFSWKYPTRPPKGDIPSWRPYVTSSAFEICQDSESRVPASCPHNTPT